MKYDYSGRFEGLDSIGPAEDIAILGQGRYLVADFNSSEGSGVYVVTTDPYRRNLIMAAIQSTVPICGGFISSGSGIDSHVERL